MEIIVVVMVAVMEEHGNGGGACSIVDEMGIKSRQCHID